MEKININGRIIFPGQIYRHFKNKLYQIIAIANHSETGEKLVIYQQLYAPFETYARPLMMFMSEVDHYKYPDVKQKYRFEEVIHEVSETKMSLKKESEIEMSLKVEPEIGMYDEESVNPYLIMFLDEDTYEEKRNVLMRAKNEMTDRLIDDIAASMDGSVDKGDIDYRFGSLLHCVNTMAKFEVNR